MPPETIELCRTGFHFCQYPVDVFRFCGQDNHVYARIKATGLVLNDDYKCVTNEITILEILTREQLMKLMPDFIERENGDREWYRNGKLHRENGPAVEFADGEKDWFLDGNWISHHVV